MLSKLFGIVFTGPFSYNSSDMGNALPSPGCFPHPRFLKDEVHIHCSTWVQKHSQAVYLDRTWNGSRLALSPSGPWNALLYFFLLWLLARHCSLLSLAQAGCSHFSEVIVCLGPWCPPTAETISKALWVLPLEQASKHEKDIAPSPLHLWPG